jgi:glycolate oxidase
MISNEAYRDLENAVGPENASREPAILDGYAWQPLEFSNPEIWLTRPIAVVLPSSTEEVQATVRICQKYKLRLKAFSTGFGAHAGAGYDNVILIDLRRMNRIIEIDEKNMFAVVEPYVCGAQLQAEAMKVGLNTHMHGAGSGASPLASATSFQGMGWDSIYMSTGVRNVLGVEWVLPSGEVLRLGTSGSGSSWFCGDGPGPSLRGIMRGWIGAAGSLGVFTKCALKLYNWPGPPQPEIKGLMLDIKTKVPPNFRLFMCAFPDNERFSEAVHKIGEAEIGYILARNSVGVLLATLTPRLLKKLSRSNALKNALSATRQQFMIMLAANSQNEIEYQANVLSKIVSENRGLLFDLSIFKPLYEMLWWDYIRNSSTPMVFRAMGNLHIGFGADEPLDSQFVAKKFGDEIKEKWISKGALLDDLTDNAWMISYENGVWSHYEEVLLFDHRNPKQREALSHINEDFVQATLDNHISVGLCAHDPVARKIFSPLQFDYNHWQKKILNALGGEDVSDTTYYTDERG